MVKPRSVPATPGSPLSLEYVKSIQRHKRVVIATVILAGALICVMIALAWKLAGDIKSCTTIVKRDGQLIADAINSPVRPNTWQQIFPLGVVPQGRMNPAACAVDGLMYAHGGASGSEVLRDLWVYTEATNTWMEEAQSGDIPSARSSHVLVNTMSGQLVLFGGFDATGTGLSGLFTYDLLTRRWTSVTATGGPQARGGHSALYHSGAVYVAGGASTSSGTTFFQELWKFSMTTRTWQALSSGPTDLLKRVLFSFLKTGSDTAALTPGWCETAVCGKVGLYTFSTDTWTVGADPTGTPTPALTDARCDVGANGIIYQYGGTDAPPNSGVSSLFAYDPTADRWMQLFPGFLRDANPPATRGHAFVNLGRRMVLFGGRTATAASPGTSQLWEYTPVPAI